MTPIEYPFLVVLVVGLVALSWQDIRHFKIPDAATLPLIAIGVLYSGAIGNGWLDSAIGLAVGYASFVGIEKLYQWFRQREGLGRGDAKLMAVGGAWCGWAGLPMILLIGSGVALGWALLIAARKGRALGMRARVPFGPFLSLGIITTLYINF